MGMSSVIGTEDDSTAKQNLSAQYQLQLSSDFRLNTIFTKDYFSSEYDDSFPCFDGRRQPLHKRESARGPSTQMDR